MMQKLQRFGGAMFVPVLLFSFSGIVVALGSLFMNPMIFGNIAKEGTMWYGIWYVISQGGWTVFNQVELLFVVGLPIGLARSSKGRAAMESLVTYLTFNYFIGGFLSQWGPFFGVNNWNKPLVANATNGGLKEIAGIKTLNTSIVGALIVAGIVIWLHNRYFDKKLPEFLGTFQGSTYIVILGFLAMIPTAFLTCLIWPKIQLGIDSMQSFMVSSGVIGVWIFNFLNRVLIPTGLHHLVYIPFQFGPAVVAGGLQPYWLQHLSEFAASSAPLKQLAPQFGFPLYGNEKVFLAPIICVAFYATAKKNKKKQTAALVIPAALTSLFAGITEPVDFTYLFAAPSLWIIYSLLAATMNTLMYSFGVVGMMTDGAIGIAAQNWIPLWANHWSTYLIQFAIGLIFAALTFFIFKFMIEKNNYLTPGREADDVDAKLMSKAEYKAAKAAESAQATDANDPYIARATAYLQLLGGPANITEINSCATRLRITVVDPNKVAPDSAFKQNKAVNVVHHGQALQVIVGLDVAQVLERMVHMINESGQAGNVNTEADDNPFVERATGFIDLLGGKENIDKFDSCATRLRVTVFDEAKVADEAAFKSVGAYALEHNGKQFNVVVGLDVDSIVAEMKQML
ncbi:PTS system maltose-specific EIICB component [Lactobacillus pasteurii DSM 23907 = CRBIP 24.76]|uniref:PTS family porter, IIBC component n=1 Tax=Lactobacillus pasteurii DSM 23907 = CRBIP 24.76 TaxID=1423790 RepID=I7IYU4_9LACO|nr:alpha-glucoside-specific PTS transporter subunit IIBC [Lactobacillus pasteurii]KRK07714.1 PTS system maltose-specific EIICB component [Lactobacillus pasteurii DSM 23907 = CRBIP 24.76]TDG77723.1 hypothetical protein C5L33_000134 [Lactobacillus pasteurii]CCI84722.1 PTS family porter, IIBC component [Lactobacillus pasteurii DSM 23907 = CRBIP 24.76]